jgi:hypothetical protein
VLNPHYRLMGLYGSEYWTYSLPRRVGAEHAARLTDTCLPVTPAAALGCGLVDKVVAGGVADFHAQVATLAAQLARTGDYPVRLAAKAEQLAAAQNQRPLAAYRAAELTIMSRNFAVGDPYHELRRAFVYKQKPTQTPPHLARRPARLRHTDAQSPAAAELPGVVGSLQAAAITPVRLPEDAVERQPTFLDCPAYLGRDGTLRCGLPAEVEERYSIGSTDGPLESARISCPQGHWFNAAIESLTIPPQPANPDAPASAPSHLAIQCSGTQVTGPIPER